MNLYQRQQYDLSEIATKDYNNIIDYENALEVLRIPLIIQHEYNNN